MTYASVLDALTNPGPGRINRIDLDTVCNQLVAPGLSLDDVLATEGLTWLALVNMLLYRGKVLDELAVMQYALQAKAQKGCTAGFAAPSSTSTTGWSPSNSSTPTTTVKSWASATTTTVSSGLRVDMTVVVVAAMADGARRLSRIYRHPVHELEYLYLLHEVVTGCERRRERYRTAVYDR